MMEEMEPVAKENATTPISIRIMQTNFSGML
jgi:hypothetical protein